MKLRKLVLCLFACPVLAAAQPIGWMAFDRSTEQLSNNHLVFDIFLMNVPDRTVTQLTTHPSAQELDSVEPALSPDGTRIVFESSRHYPTGKTTDLYIMDAADTDNDGQGDNCARLTNYPGDDAGPSWSPDGTKIAFSRRVNGQRDIYYMLTDGSSITQVTDNTLADANPAWAPDGTRIAFQREIAPYPNRNSEIFGIDVDGTDETRLTTNTAFDSHPDWSYEQTPRLVFSANIDDPNTLNIYIMDAVDGDEDGNGDNQQRLTNAGLHDVEPVVSPDGVYVGYVRYMAPPQETEIYATSIGGGPETNLTNDPSAESSPYWGTPPTEFSFEGNKLPLNLGPCSFAGSS